MKVLPTMQRFLCDKPVVWREVLTETGQSDCYVDTTSFYLTDDDRDSGTESDDEGAEIEELQKYMESFIHLGGTRHNETRRFTKRHSTPSHHLHQVTTAEEDGADVVLVPLESSSPRPEQRHHSSHHHRRRTASTSHSPALDSALPSDSDQNGDHHSSEEELEGINSSSPRLHHPEKRKWGGGESADDDDFLVCSGLVEFCTLPPADVHKPSKCLRQAHIPPHELCSMSPRKRYRRTPTGHNIPRPCLDFEKMQQGIRKVGPFSGGGPRWPWTLSTCALTDVSA